MSDDDESKTRGPTNGLGLLSDERSLLSDSSVGPDAEEDGPEEAQAASHTNKRVPEQPDSQAGSADRLRELQWGQGLDVRSLELWAASPERTWYLERRRRIYVYVTAGVAIVLAALTLWGYTLDKSLSSTSVGRVRFSSICTGVVGAIVLAWCTVPYWAARRAFLDRRRALAAYRVDVALRRVFEFRLPNDDLPLAGLFELNRRQLDEYQEITKRQQRLAFRLTWAASTLAFAVLILGTVVALNVPEGSAQYVAGGLTGVGTLLSGFLGKTFFEGHRHAMDQLNLYYDEPSMTGRMLAAERVAQRVASGGLSEDAKQILETILTWKPHGSERRAPASEQARE